MAGYPYKGSAPLALPSKFTRVVRVCAWADPVAKTASSSMIAKASAAPAARSKSSRVQLRLGVALFMSLFKYSAHFESLAAIVVSNRLLAGRNLSECRRTKAEEQRARKLEGACQVFGQLSIRCGFSHVKMQEFADSAQPRSLEGSRLAGNQSESLFYRILLQLLQPRAGCRRFP